MESVTIGTRGSELALWQANYVAGKLHRLFPDTEIKQKLITSKGDKILDVPLAKIGGKGLFTKELEEAMLTGEIDLAVHSLKDMPTKLPPGLTIAAVTKREQPLDAVVSPTGQKLSALPTGAVIGTSSLRRQAQLLHYRADLQIVNLRGNVNTRLAKLAAGEFDAVVLAAAGLYRLGKASVITEILSPDVILPAVGQGALAVEMPSDSPLKNKIARLNDEPTFIATSLERSFLSYIEGGCQVPVGVYAQAGDKTVTATAIIASVNGSKLLRQSITGESERAAELGAKLAQNMLEAGGREILQEIGLCA